jgi:hypothetical protein
MMTKMSWVPANGVAPMAVAAAHLALVDLCLEKGQRMFIERECHHALAPFRAHMVELQDHDIRFSAADARSVPKVVQDET